ncbi:MAG: Ig-like domain-containing protein [Gemmatimonadetes bacterium]|nr:Ig-like domain-containing protein [Gemmatimonadota bacterium]
MHRGPAERRALVVLLGVALTACAEPDTPFQVAVTPGTVSLAALGETKQLTAKVTNEKGKDLTGAIVTWSSSSATVAGVDAAGMVTAVGNGSAQVTATAGTVSGSATVTVAQVLASVEATTGASQSGPVAQALPTPLAVRIRDSRGNGVAGVAVTFAVSPDGGTVSSSSGTTGNDGQVSTTWTFGTKAGSHQVTANITGSATTVVFTGAATPGPAVVLSKVSGDNQFGYKASRLPQPVAVRVRDQYANGIRSYLVTFDLETGGGALDSETVFTDTAGVARTTWVLPNALDTVTATASAQGPGGTLAGSPLTFTAIAHGLRVTSVSPSPLIEGQPAVLMGEGFDPTAANNAVTVGGVAATVTATTPTQLDIVVPSSDCQPTRSASVVVTAGGFPSAPVATTVNPAAPVSLAVGQQLIVRDPTQFCFQFPKTAAQEVYLIGVQSTSETVTDLTPITLAATSAAPATAPPAVARTAPGIEAAPVDLRRLRRIMRHRAAELAQREVDRAVFEAGSRLPRAPAAPSAIVDSLKNVGDTVLVRWPAGGGCTNYAELKTVVRAKGQKGMLLHDVASPSGGFDASHFTQFSQDFDAKYYANDVAYFGAPPDADGNGRVVLVFTPEVNKFNALGRMISCDLFPRSSHPASNEGEFFYAAVPDPADSFFVADAVALMPGTLTHELVHVIQFTGRQTAGGPFPSTWIAEGQAVLGEEIVGHAVEGRSPGQNYGLRIAINLDDTSSIDWYLWPVVIDLGLYFGWDPVSTPGNFDGRVAQAPHECSWLEFKPPNPGPCVGGRDPYVAWAMLRWLSDRFYTPATESGFHKAIISSTQNGFAMIQSLIGVPMDSLLAQFAAMLYVDDRDDMTAPAAAALRMSSWDLFNIFYETDPQTNIRLRTALRLQPAAVTYSTFTRSARVRAASTYYAVVSGFNREATAIRARDGAGAPLPPWMRSWIVRLQ